MVFVGAGVNLVFKLFSFIQWWGNCWSSSYYIDFQIVVSLIAPLFWKKREDL